MTKRLMLAALLALGLAGPAQAQRVYTDIHGAGGNEVVPLVGCDANGNCTGPASTANPSPVSDLSVVNAINAAKLTPPLSVKGQSIFYADVSALVVTATGNSGALAFDAGTSLGAEISVASVTGTAPTMDMALWLSLDGGTTFKEVFDCPRMSASVTTCHVPEMQFDGVRKWIWTVAGTTPSFTLSIGTTRGNANAPLIRMFYDRTINPNIGSTFSPTWDIAGCKSGYAYQSTNGAETSAATLQPFLSPDGALFASFGSTFQTGNSLNSQSSISNAPMQYVRIATTVAGTGITLNFVTLYCTN